ncbi:hypothetical protein H6G93_17660 [Nostoc sp. FACHB-973]|nr:hypothetical protein [Nostoc sp. FACHB-973]MBX9257279.1 hypothetical protein [Desmonostoc muscorum CCALA 125]
MNLVHILLNVAAPTADSPKWTEIVQAITSIIVAIPTLDWIDEKLQGNVAKMNPDRALEKAQNLVVSSLIRSVESLQKIIPNTQLITNLLQALKKRNQQLQKKINELKIRSKYRESAAKWLNSEKKQKELSTRVAQIALKNSPHPQQIEDEERLQENIQDFLELIQECLVNFGRPNILTDYINGDYFSRSNLGVPPALYMVAFNALKKEAKNELPDSKVYREVEDYLECLEREFSKNFLSN